MSGPIRGALRLFYDLDGFFLAAGLSFYVIICILPFVLLLVAGGAFLLSDEMVVRQVLARLAVILPVYQREMERLLRGVIAGREVTSAVGTAILLPFASQLFAATRLVLNRIFAMKGRGFVHGVLFDVWMILVLSVLFFVTVGISAGFAWILSLASLSDRGTLAPSLLHWAGLLFAIGLDTTLFVVLYRFVPNTRLPWSSVLAGGAATALLWELAKQLFRWYIEEVGVYSAVYGSLGVALALIMWVYYSAIVFVWGAALVRAFEERRNGRQV